MAQPTPPPASSLLPAQLPVDDSMLSRKLGPELVTYFSGNPLNRVGFLRADHAFLQAAFAHPSTRLLVLDGLAPLIDPATTRLAWVKREEVAPVIGEDPFAKPEEDMIRDFNSEDALPLVLLLGVDDRQRYVAAGAAGAAESAQPANGSGGEEPVFRYKEYQGTPYFAVDITPRGAVADQAKQLVDKLTSRGLAFPKDQRSIGLGGSEAAIYGQARSMAVWNDRNPFCAQCGQQTLSVHAGYKRACPATDRAGTKDGSPPRDRAPCATRGTISNVSFPRTDPTVIVAVASADGSRVLLGRNKRWPPHWYSTLAGFLEPGESIEEAVRREVWEESGVAVGRVVLHSSQPWPFPASLMIGAIAQALPGEGERIFLGNDPELDHARWVPLEELRAALATGVSNLGQPPPEGYKEGDLRLPPETAIANRLLTAVAEGYLGASPKI